jgi:hypothetical protein
VDLTTAAPPSPDAKPVSGPEPARASVALRGVLTAEEERFIAGLFEGSEGPTRGGRVYSQGGRAVPGSAPGIRMDLRA